MSCTACAISVESTLSATKGVEKAAVNYAMNTVVINYNDRLTNIGQLKSALQAIGYDLGEDPGKDVEKLQQQEGKRLTISRNKTLFAIGFSIPVVILAMAFHKLPYVSWIMMILTVPVLAWFGREFFIHAYKRAIHLSSNMDTLVAIGTGSAFIFSAFNHFPILFYKTRTGATCLFRSRSRDRFAHLIRKIF